MHHLFTAELFLYSGVAFFAGYFLVFGLLTACGYPRRQQRLTVRRVSDDDYLRGLVELYQGRPWENVDIAIVCEALARGEARHVSGEVKLTALGIARVEQWTHPGLLT